MRRPSEAQLAGVNRVAVVAEGDSAFEVLSARVKTGAVHPVMVGDGPRGGVVGHGSIF